MASAFGTYIRTKRVEGGLSLRQVADTLKVSHVFLGEVERGLKGAMRREHWSALVEVVPGVTINELEEAAKVSAALPMEVRVAPPEYQGLHLALSRRIQNKDLSADVIHRLRQLLGDDDE